MPAAGATPAGPAFRRAVVGTVVRIGDTVRRPAASPFVRPAGGAPQEPAPSRWRAGPAVTGRPVRRARAVSGS